MNEPYKFLTELTNLINKFSAENDSNTPDYILAKYMKSCLEAFNEATVERKIHYGMEKSMEKKMEQHISNIDFKYTLVSSPKEEFLMPADTYYVGDLCYVFDDEEWSCFLDDAMAQRTKGQHWSSLTEGAFHVDDDKYVWYHGTEYGDGSYSDQKGNLYSVDSGTIGVIPVNLITKDLNEDEIKRLGNVVEFSDNFEVSYKAGTFKIGHIIIPTGEED